MKRKSNPRNKRSTTKSVLRLPDLEHAKTAVLNSLTSRDAQRGYRHAINEFVDWYCSEPRLAFNRIVVLRYRSHLESRQRAPGTINPRLAAVRRLAYEAADCGLLSADLAAGIRRAKGVKKLGVRLRNWLTAEQSHALWQAPDHRRLKGKRDRALLALLLACGLRRHEAAALTLDHLQQREEHWAIVDLVGKGGHVRTVPLPDWVRNELDDWLAAAAIDRGRLFRRVNKVGNQVWSVDFMTDALSSGRRFRILNIVDDYTRECLAIEVDTSLGGVRVVRVLAELKQRRGLPQQIRSDNGPEFVSRAVDQWAYDRACSGTPYNQDDQWRTAMWRASTDAFVTSA